jgi:hypothetical protein
VLHGRAPARHELPDIDAAALTVARAVDALLAQAARLTDTPDVIAFRQRGALGASGDTPVAPAVARWAAYFHRLPDELRDEPVSQLRNVARRARAAYGPKDSIRDVFSPDVTEPLLDSIDRLLKAIARYESDR